jgi:membrane protease YdiL (CAAX protease family)
MRDLLVQGRPDHGAVIAGAAYAGLLAAALIAMRAAGISAAELGIRGLTARSALLGVGAGFLVVAPVQHLPHLLMAGTGWLPVAVIVEEVVFRGLLFALLRRLGGQPLAIGGSAALFTAAHLGGYGWPALALVALAGLFLGLLRAISHDLWAPAFAHLLMDLVSLQ